MSHALGIGHWELCTVMDSLGWGDGAAAGGCWWQRPSRENGRKDKKMCLRGPSLIFLRESGGFVCYATGQLSLVRLSRSTLSIRWNWLIRMPAAKGTLECVLSHHCFPFSRMDCATSVFQPPCLHFSLGCQCLYNQCDLKIKITQCIWRWLLGPVYDQSDLWNQVSLIRQ